jgi:putative flippase GtrA
VILRTVLRGTFSDAQCGFKALRRDVAQELLPKVQDQHWFFDTELLVLAQRHGLRIHEVPVDWIDDLDSRVDVFHTAADDLRGVWRLLRSPEVAADTEHPREATSSELLHFAGVGIVSTAAYFVVFLALHPLVGGLGANSIAMTACSVGNTVAHRRLSQGAARRLGRPRWMLTGTALLALSLGLTTAALVAADALSGTLWSELIALVVANGVAAAVRFSLLRSWVFRPTYSGGSPTTRGSGASR